MSESGSMLDELDARGGVRESLLDVLGVGRAELLLGALAGAAGWTAGRAGDAVSAGLTENDTRILRFDLQLEYLQAMMYTQALRLGHLRPAVREAARVVGAHEWAHARALKGILGPRAVRRGFFDYHGVTEDERAFLRTAVAFEDLTAALLKYQAVRLDSRAVLAAAISLHSVEARHAAWLRRVAGVLPTLKAFDRPASQAKMRDLVLSTHFLAKDPTTGARRAPGFTG
jgi:ferritin-like protein